MQQLLANYLIVLSKICFEILKIIMQTESLKKKLSRIFFLAEDLERISKNILNAQEEATGEKLSCCDLFTFNNFILPAFE